MKEEIKFLAPTEKTSGLSWMNEQKSVEEQPALLAGCTAHSCYQGRDEVS